MSPQNLLRKQGVFLGALTECPEENPLSSAVTTLLRSKGS